MKRLMALSGLLLLASGCGDDATGPSGNEGWKSYTAGGMEIQWRVTENQTVLQVKLSAPTTGWVAVGFDPTVMMKDANFIIGYVQGGTGYIRDDFGTGATTHQADTTLGGTSDVTLLGSGETGSTTTIEFSIHMNSGDEYDSALVQGSTHTFLLAYGPNGGDDFGTPHQFVQAVALEL